MSDLDKIVGTVKANLYKSHSEERDYWNNASNEVRSILLKSDLSENAYQQDYVAKFNQLVRTDYNTLPESIRNSITESLIAQGELPNTSDSQGVGLDFIASPFTIEKEVFVECDRCDEVFMDEEDFEQHKTIDHGDEVTFNIQESQALSMNPNVSRDSLNEAKKILASDKAIFNNQYLPNVDLEEPSVDGITSYNDNPNEGLYDNTIFRKTNALNQKDEDVRVYGESHEEDKCPNCEKSTSLHKGTHKGDEYPMTCDACGWKGDASDIAGLGYSGESLAKEDYGYWDKDGTYSNKCTICHKGKNLASWVNCHRECYDGMYK